MEFLFLYPAAEFTLEKECVLPEKTEQQGPLSTHLRGAPADAAYLLSADMICRAAKDNTQSTLALWQRSKMCPPQNKKKRQPRETGLVTTTILFSPNKKSSTSCEGIGHTFDFKSYLKTSDSNYLPSSWLLRSREQQCICISESATTELPDSPYAMVLERLFFPPLCTDKDVNLRCYFS